MRRPAGTDGSDHGYRETVDDAYKGAPIWRTAGWLFLHATSIPMVLKVLWSLIPYFTLEVYPELAPFVLLALYLIAVVCWKLARPATYNENFNLVKITNSCMMLGTVLHFATLYKYHVMDIKQKHYSRRIWKYLSEEEGWTGAGWVTFLDRLEAFIDGSTVLMWGLTFYCFHNYITRKMQMDKKLQLSKKRDGPNATAPAAAAITNGVSAPKGAAKRRTART